MVRTHRIERRLLEAVLLALASAACQPPPPMGPGEVAQPAAQPVVVRVDAGLVVTAPVDGAEVYVPPPAVAIIDAGVPVQPDAAVTVVPVANAAPVADVAVVYDPDASELCATYKQRAFDSRRARGAGERPAPDPRRVIDQAEWNDRRNVAECTIVREVKEATVKIMHTPQCCPQPGPPSVGPGRGQRPACGAPREVMVPGKKALVEDTVLTARGRVVKRRLYWIAVEAKRPARHYCGRLPEGLELVGEPVATCEVGAELAAMAELEAASVPAFARLARELERHGAPGELIRRARIAMRDEVRHARVLRELARRHGARPREVEVVAPPERSLTEFARDNAVEGCVREAYGALVATYQAAAAPAELRPPFATIARDERRHAALAEEVDAWVRTQLAAAACDQLDRARRDACAELRARLVDLPPVDGLGIPGGSQAVALFDAYFA